MGGGDAELTQLQGKAHKGSLQATARENRAAVLKSAKTQKCQHRTKVLTKGKHWELGQRPSLFIIIRRHRGGSNSSQVEMDICKIKDLSERKGTLGDCFVFKTRVRAGEMTQQVRVLGVQA